jgi:hypothetical protein
MRKREGWRMMEVPYEKGAGEVRCMSTMPSRSSLRWSRRKSREGRQQTNVEGYGVKMTIQNHSGSFEHYQMF